MSLYIDSKKVSNIYHGGRAVTGIYRDGMRLWGKEGSTTIKGIKVEAMEDIDRIYLNYALAEVGDGQVDSWADVEVGSKTFRLAGDTTSRNKAYFAADTLTWGNVKVTSNDAWVGSYITVKIKVAQMARKATSVSWETNNKGTASFGMTALAPETSYRISLYNPITKVLDKSRGIKGKLGVTMRVSDAEVDSYSVNISLGSKASFAKEWEVSEDIHHLFAEQKTVKFGVALTDISYIGPNMSGDDISLRSIMNSKESCGLFMETEAIERTIRLKVKEVVK
ncbi:MAG: hypothetical protein IKW19_05920 [Akkermansia sp.]|nr:hypothetical protein [Akkermansia sp.]